MAHHRHQYLTKADVAMARSQTAPRSSQAAPPVDDQEAERQGSRVLAYVDERRALEGIAPNPELRSRIRAAADEWPDQ